MKLIYALCAAVILLCSCNKKTPVVELGRPFSNSELRFAVLSSTTFRSNWHLHDPRYHAVTLEDMKRWSHSARSEVMMRNGDLKNCNDYARVLVQYAMKSAGLDGAETMPAVGIVIYSGMFNDGEGHMANIWVDEDGKAHLFEPQTDGVPVPSEELINYWAI